MTDDELREQLALYAVGALTDAERTELDEMLRTRPDLQAELAELQEAAALLADATQEAPPPTLRATILDRIAETPQLPRERGQPPARPDTRIAPVVPIRRRRNRFVAIGSAAAAIVAVTVGVLIVSPWNDGESDPIAAVVEAPDAQRIAMPGELGDLTIVHSAGEGAAVLLADSVPVPEGDRVYELWAIRGGTPERFATFRPNDDGSLAVYAAGLDPASAEVWAITEEPAGGSDAPTTPVLNATA